MARLLSSPVYCPNLSIGKEFSMRRLTGSQWRRQPGGVLGGAPSLDGSDEFISGIWRGPFSTPFEDCLIRSELFAFRLLCLG